METSTNNIIIKNEEDNTMKNMEKELFKIKNVTFIDAEYDSQEAKERPILVTAINNLISYGFIVDEKSYKLLSKATDEDITEWYFNTIEWIKEFYGNHKYVTFYSNFPKEVMEKDDIMLLVDQLMHYWFGYMPEGTDSKDEIKSLEDFKLRVISVTEKNKIHGISKKIFKSYLRTKSNLSETEVSYINEYLKFNKIWYMFLEEKIENRKLLCSLVYMFLKCTSDIHFNTSFAAFFENTFIANDYLRLAVLLSNIKGDQDFKYVYNSLDDNFKLGSSIPRRYRKMIVKEMSKLNNLEEDVARNKAQFKKLFQIIHAYEYKNIASEKFNYVVYCLRNNKKLETFYSKVEEAYATKNKKEIEKLFSSRPGEFAKNISRLLDTFEVWFVHNLCKDILPLVKLEDLYSLYNYFKGRRRKDKLAVHNVKGQLYLDENKKYYEYISMSVAEPIVNIIFDCILAKIGFIEGTEKIYKEDMKNYVIPTDIANSNDSVESYTKGSRIDLEKNEDGTAKNLRVGIWWTNNEDNKAIDIDLSASFYNNNLQKLNSISYASSYKFAGCVHSGDITNGGSVNGEGVAEFIDIPFKELEENDVAYVRFYVNVFSGSNFNELKNCEFSIQQRNELDKSEKYNIKAVTQHSRLSSNAKAATPCILDVKNKQLIWIDNQDYNVKNCTNVFDKNVEGNFAILLDKYGSKDIMNIETLLEKYADYNKNVSIVHDLSEATIAFSVDRLDKIPEGCKNVTVKDIQWFIENMMTESK